MTKRKVYLAATVNDLREVRKMPRFSLPHSYSLDGLDVKKEEIGRVEHEEIDFRILAFLPDRLLNLKECWENPNGRDVGDCIEKKNCAVVTMNSFSDENYSFVVNMLIEWAVQNPLNTFPPNFKIETKLNTLSSGLKQMNVICKFKEQNITE